MRRYASHCLAAATLLALAACAGGGQSGSVTGEPQAGEPAAVLAGPDALTIPEYGREPGPRTRHRKPLFDLLACKAAPGETCRGRYRFEADPGFQICWMNYDLVTQEGRVRFLAEPADYVAGDPQSPDRFRAQDVLIEAEGGGFSGAEIRVENGFFWLLPLSSDENDRRALGCRMPNRG